MRIISITVLLVIVIPYEQTVVANKDFCITKIAKDKSQWKFVQEGNCLDPDTSEILKDILTKSSTESPEHATTAPETPHKRTEVSCCEICKEVMNGIIPNQPIGLASRGSFAKIFPNFLGGEGIEVYCDCSNGSHWTVFQRRMDGSVDFYRNWTEYALGFGNVIGEFWLGLDLIHNFTKAGNYSLKIDLKDTVGNKTYAEYSSFSIGNSSTNYTLFFNGYRGNTEDGLNYHNLAPFSTFDRDNDRDIRNNCAKIYKSAWWFNNCHDSDLNARFKGLCWANECYTQATEMKFRKN